MSVTIDIRQKGLFKKEVTMSRVADLLGLSFGISDSNFILQEGELGDIVVFYDSQRIGRGFECSIEGKDIRLRLPLPSTPHDIDLFYRAAAALCRYVKTGKVLVDGETVVHTDRFPELAQNNRSDSSRALEDMKNKSGGFEGDTFMIMSARNPISFGPGQLSEVGSNLNAFEELLHRLQSRDVYFAGCKYFQRNSDSSVFGVYFIGDGIASVVPRKPAQPLAISDAKVGQFYVCLPQKNAVPYGTFIDNVAVVDEYDAGSVIVCLNEKQINDIIAKGTVDMQTDEPIPFNPYHREQTH